MDAMILGEWNGTRIRVNPSDADYVNATDMCRAAGKLWGNYWQNTTTQGYVEALSGSIGIPIDRLVISVSSGANESRGTWVHRRVALHLAQWCSPAFSVWVTGKIEELMATGKVVLHKEHQEAELYSLIVSQCDRQDRTLTVVENQQSQFNSLIGAFYQCSSDQKAMLEAMQRAPVYRVEAAVEAQLVRTEGGIRQVAIGYNDKIDVLQNDRHVIEVKHASKWKEALGQVQRYARQIPNATKRIHLFYRPGEAGWSDSKRTEMEEHCRESGVTVTWHEWTFEALPQRQQFLNLTH